MSLPRRIIIIDNPTQQDIDHVFGLSGSIPITTVSQPDPNMRVFPQAMGIPASAASPTITLGAPLDPELDATQQAGEAAQHAAKVEAVIPPPAYTPEYGNPPTLSGMPDSINTGHALDLDSAGVAWDPNLHASSKVKNANGKWKARRGLGDKDPSPIAGTAWKDNEPTPAPAPPVATPTPTPTPSAALGATPALPNLMQPPVDTGAIFTAFVTRASQSINAGEITKDDLNKALVTHNLTAITQLRGQSYLIPRMEALLWPQG